jgi:hypothetical protein
LYPRNPINLGLSRENKITGPLPTKDKTTIYRNIRRCISVVKDNVIKIIF